MRSETIYFLRGEKLSAIVVLWLVAILSPPLGAQSATEIYQKGLVAFQNENYLLALKNLYAYQQISLAVLSANPTFASKLQKAIDYSEDQLRIAVETKRQLDRYGEVREIRFVAKGKADHPNPPVQTVPYRPPRPRFPAKPGLPTTLPQEQVAIKDSGQLAHEAEPLTKGGTLKRKSAGATAQSNEALEKLMTKYRTIEKRHEQLSASHQVLSERCAALKKQLELVTQENAELKRKLQQH